MSVDNILCHVSLSVIVMKYILCLCLGFVTLLEIVQIYTPTFSGPIFLGSQSSFVTCSSAYFLDDMHLCSVFNYFFCIFISQTIGQRDYVWSYRVPSVAASLVGQDNTVTNQSQEVLVEWMLSPRQLVSTHVRATSECSSF